MKEKITTFIHGLITYDYILFGVSFVLFLLLIILSIILRKRTSIAVIVMLLAFTTLFIAPSLGYIKLHEFLFKNSVTLIKQKRLTYTKAIYIEGSITNQSLYDFKNCKVTTTIFKVSKNKFKNIVYRFKPMKKRSILISDIKKDDTKKFKLFVEPFTYTRDYNLTLEANCK